MELPYLTQHGVMPFSNTRGVLRNCPLDLQFTIVSPFVSYAHSMLLPFLPLLKNAPRGSTTTNSSVPDTSLSSTLLRSEEDLVYITNTVGIAFSFPCVGPLTGGSSSAAAQATGNYYETISKAIDIYGILMSASFQETVLGHFQPGVGCKHFVLMFEHLTALLHLRDEVVSSHRPPPPSLAPRTQSSSTTASIPAQGAAARQSELIAKLVDTLSRCLTQSARRLSQGQWTHILKMLSGCMQYWAAPSSGQYLSPPVRCSLASLHWEAVVLSETTDNDAWEALANSNPTTTEVAVQWGRVVVALTRAMSRIVMQRARGAESCAFPTVHVRWGGLQPSVRIESKFTGLTADTVTYLWKRLVEVIYQQRRELLAIDTMVVLAGALRDMALLLSHSSYLTYATEPSATGEAAVGNISVPLGPTTVAVCALLGDKLLEFLTCPLGHVSKPSDDRDALRIRALQGLSFALFRRETAVAFASGDPLAMPKHLEIMFSAISVIGSDSPNVRCELVLHAAALFFVDLPVPLLAIEAIGNAACSLSGGLLDVGGEEDEGDDEAGDIARAAVNKVWAVTAVLNAYMHCKILGLPSALPNTVFAAVHAGLETQLHLAPVVQRLLCVSVALFFKTEGQLQGSGPAGHNPKLSDILQTILGIVAAPYGSTDQDTLLTALLCVGWLPLELFQPAIAKHVIAALCQCCMSARAVMEQADLGIEDTTAVYVHASRAICNIISNMLPIAPSGVPFGRLMCSDSAVFGAIAKAIEAGTRDALVADSSMRDAAETMYHSLLWALGAPVVDGGTCSSCPETEEAYLAEATSIRCLAIGSFKLVTLIQYSRGVAIVIRGPSGRRVLRASPAALPSMSIAEDAEVFAALIDSASVGEGVLAEQLMGPLDPLEGVWAEPATVAMLSDLQKSVSSRSTLTSMERPLVTPVDSECTVSADKSIPDIASDHEVSSRLAATVVMQLGKGAIRDIPFDATLVGALKGIDSLSDKELVDVAVVCVVSAGGDAPQAFWAFVASLGWPLGEGPECLVFEDGGQRIHFYPSVVSAEDLDAEEQRRAMAASPPIYSSVRVLWDFTKEGFDWPNITHAAHDAFKELTPDYRPSYHRQCFDIILRPLPNVGLTSVRLQLPEPLVASVECPLRWGAPLLHGTVLPSSLLPRVLRASIQNAVVQRLMEAGRYKFPTLVRKAAIWAVIEGNPVLLPLQYTAKYN